MSMPDREFPVSLKDFTKFTYYEEVIEKLMERKAGGNSKVLENLRKSKKAKQQLFQNYYVGYFTSAEIRQAFPIRFKRIPKKKKDKFLEYAKYLKKKVATEKEDANDHEVAKCHGRLEEDSLEEKQSNCNVTMVEAGNAQVQANAERIAENIPSISKSKVNDPQNSAIACYNEQHADERFKSDNGNKPKEGNKSKNETSNTCSINPDDNNCNAIDVDHINGTANTNCGNEARQKIMQGADFQSHKKIKQNMNSDLPPTSSAPKPTSVTSVEYLKKFAPYCPLTLEQFIKYTNIMEKCENKYPQNPARAASWANTVYLNYYINPEYRRTDKMMLGLKILPTCPAELRAKFYEVPYILEAVEIDQNDKFPKLINDVNKDIQIGENQERQQVPKDLNKDIENSEMNSEALNKKISVSNTCDKSTTANEDDSSMPKQPNSNDNNLANSIEDDLKALLSRKELQNKLSQKLCTISHNFPLSCNNFPVTFEEFKECSLYKESLERILYDFCGSQVDAVRCLKENQEMYKCLQLQYYKSFFSKPYFRKKYPLRFKKTPECLIKKIINFIDEIDEANNENLKEDAHTKSKTISNNKQSDVIDSTYCLEKIKKMFSLPFKRTHKLGYVLRTSFDLKQRILEILTSLSFEEFKSMTLLYEERQLTLDDDNCWSYLYDCVNNLSVWPQDLYIELESVLIKLQQYNDLWKKICREASSLIVHISPKFLHWSNLLQTTDFLDCVCLDYKQRMGEPLQMNRIEAECNNYYSRCWSQDKWICQIPVINKDILDSLPRHNINEEANIQIVPEHALHVVTLKPVPEIINSPDMPAQISNPVFEHEEEDTVQSLLAEINNLSFEYDENSVQPPDENIFAEINNLSFEYDENSVEPPDENINSQDTSAEINNQIFENEENAIQPLVENKTLEVPSDISNQGIQHEDYGEDTYKNDNDNSQIVDDLEQQLRALHGLPESSTSDISHDSNENTQCNDELNESICYIAVQNTQDQISSLPAETADRYVMDPLETADDQITNSDSSNSRELITIVSDKNIKIEPESKPLLNHLKFTEKSDGNIECQSVEEEIIQLDTSIIQSDKNISDNFPSSEIDFDDDKHLKNPSKTVQTYSQDVINSGSSGSTFLCAQPITNDYNVSTSQADHESQQENATTKVLPTFLSQNLHTLLENQTSNNIMETNNSENLSGSSLNDSICIVNEIENTPPATSPRVLSASLVTINSEVTNKNLPEMLLSNTKDTATSEKIQNLIVSVEIIQNAPSVTTPPALTEHTICMNSKVVNRSVHEKRLSNSKDTASSKEIKSVTTSNIVISNEVGMQEVQPVASLSKLTERRVGINAGITTNNVPEITLSNPKDTVTIEEITPVTVPSTATSNAKAIQRIQHITSPSVKAKKSLKPSVLKKNLQTKVTTRGQTKASNSTNTAKDKRKESNSAINEDYVPQLVHSLRPLPLRIVKPSTSTKDAEEKACLQSSLSGSLRISGDFVPAITSTQTNSSSLSTVSSQCKNSLCPSAIRASQELAKDCTIFNNTSLLRIADQMPAEPTPLTQSKSPKRPKKVISTTATTTSSHLPIPSKNYILRAPKTKFLIYYNLLEFRYFHKLKTSHVAENQLNVHNIGLSHMEGMLTFGNLRTRLTNTSLCSLQIFSNKIKYGIFTLLRDLGEYHFKRSHRSQMNETVDIRERVLFWYFYSISPFCFAQLIYNENDFEYSECKTIKNLSDVPHRKPFICLTNAIKPHILEAMKKLKKDLREVKKE